MKILLTGSKGFIGKNLISHLKEDESIEILTFDSCDNFSKIEDNIEDIDFIFHFAAVIKSKNDEEFYLGNSNLTKKIVDLIKDKNIPLLFTSTIHSGENTCYGKTKQIAEEYIINNLNKSKYYVFRLHNVFGKWCKPNYNSVVSTFCYNISHDLEINIYDPNIMVPLIYIDDVVEEFLNIMKGGSPMEIDGNYCFINPRYNVTLEYISSLLYQFKKLTNYNYVPNIEDEFVKKLYLTYVSYVDVNKNIIDISKKQIKTKVL